ncbi:hypothetical protein ACJRO7_010387 [Eucalyptus globulus]|uniref:Protein FAR1-RELATED SEQUENCE n=1 Tax=Eucalyptus globulus TaxID=34317 RepID=A0ABD3LC14_EUCGL
MVWSRVDRLVCNGRFVCWKEGFQINSRTGRPAFIRVKKSDSGKWENHPANSRCKSSATTARVVDLCLKLVPYAGLKLDLANEAYQYYDTYAGNVEFRVCISQLIHTAMRIKRHDNGRWIVDRYQLEHNHELEMQMKANKGSASRKLCRFTCSQFGDTIIFYASYSQNNYVVPFATFVGVNHHKQLVLLGCALVADELKESFIWLFKTWLRAMSGCHPKLIIADQDYYILQKIAQVFPSSHHRFSIILSPLSSDCKYEYEKCVYQSHIAGEFDVAWDAPQQIWPEGKCLAEGNQMWLKEIYEKHENCVPLYLYAYFDPYLNSQVSLEEFVVRYEQGLEQRCVFQRELRQSCSYLRAKIHEQGAIRRYLIRKCGNKSQKHIVTFCLSNLHVSCGCRMFKLEAVLCGHALRLFQILDIREFPSHYILHRWMSCAEYGTMHDLKSGNSSHENKAKIIWKFGATSFEKYKLAHEIMHEGGRKLCWQR